MIQTSKEMCKNAQKQLKKADEKLEKEKDELADLENQLKVEERILTELREKKDALKEDQKYIVIAVQSEIIMEKNRIAELETNVKLSAKKCEVLSRDWDF